MTAFAILFTVASIDTNAYGAKYGMSMKFCVNETFDPSECNERYEGIGWTDRINVLIKAPGFNENPYAIDTIGNDDDPIDVYTRDNRLENVEFSETGIDTGIFMGVIKLTGEAGYTIHDTFRADIQTTGMTMTDVMTGMEMDMATGEMTMVFQDTSSFDRAAMIATQPQDGAITVNWNFHEDEYLSKSATYGWQVGAAEFKKEVYDINEPVTFFIRDADLWKHHAEFFTNYVNVYSDSDPAGIYVGVQFTKNMEHAQIDDGFTDRHLTTVAASSLTKYTPDGKWKTYFWTEPAGVLGINQDYDLNLMVHDGRTDIHEMGLSYDMDIYLNGELVESRPNQYSADGQGVQPVRFDERGSAKIVISNIFNDEKQTVNFSFQIAPEAILKEVVPRHPTHEEAGKPDYLKGYEHPHYYNYLEGEFYMTTTDSSSSRNKLHVENGDSIYVSYNDITLPKPYLEGEELDIVAIAAVVDTGRYSSELPVFVKGR